MPPKDLAAPSRLVSVKLAPPLAVLGVAAALELTLLVEGSSDALGIALERKKGRKWKPAGAPLTLAANAGLSELTLDVPAKKGKYRVRASGQSGDILAPFKLKKRRPPRR